MFASGRDSTPILDLRDVTRSFGHLDVVKSVNLAITQGDYLAITGASGSGKSTLLNLLGLLDKPSGGAVWLRGERVDGLSDAELSALRGRTVGFVFQAFHLLDSRSTTSNVELGMLYRGWSPTERQRRALEALERVKLAHRANAFPPTLSGGERQRVAIARALAADVEILLADEPTGNLDSETGTLVMQVLEEQHARGLTLVLVTHSEAIAARATRQFTMKDGVLSVRIEHG